MTKIDFHNTCAVILAAGKGTRMKSGEVNKVALEIGGKPIILRTVERLKSAGIENVYVVVGHAKESVQNVLKDDVFYIEQKEQLGTGHAVQVAIKEIPQKFENVFVFYGDDTSYDNEVLEKLFDRHTNEKNALTFLTFEMDDPTGYGRIKRDHDGKLLGIVEEKNATEEEKKIKEINPGCFLFDRKFLHKFIGKIPLNDLKKEYYITDMIEIGLRNRLKIEAVKSDNNKWQGINTLEELKKAEKYLM